MIDDLMRDSDMRIDVCDDLEDWKVVRRVSCRLTLRHSIPAH